MLDPTETEQKSVRPHNLVTEDTTIGINLAAVDMITERFTRHLRLGLLEVLRTSPRVTADRVKTVKFSEYLGRPLIGKYNENVGFARHVYGGYRP